MRSLYVKIYEELQVTHRNRQGREINTGISEGGICGGEADGSQQGLRGGWITARPWGVDLFLLNQVEVQGIDAGDGFPPEVEGSVF